MTADSSEGRSASGGSAPLEGERHPSPGSPSERYERLCRPGLVPLLRAMKLDVVYERAEGDRLWLREDGQLVEVLDLVGGFGTTLLGHNNSELLAEQRRLMEARVPSFVQGSVRMGALLLAEELCRRIGDFVVTFTNSGTEAVEAALKHALLERQRPLVWAVRRSFHGKTLGAVQLTEDYGAPFQGSGPKVRFLDPHRPEDLSEASQLADQVAAAFIEPIQGEGGIRLLPPEFLARLADTCRDAGIPLVADEIQTGLGRTGAFLASRQLGLEPDYVCLAKGLGGGLAKVGALLVRRERSVASFSRIHTSTFAEDEPGCRLALKALEIAERDGLAERCRELGAYLLSELEEVRSRHPEVLLEVRGMGLMAALELGFPDETPSPMLRVARDQGRLGALAAGYFLKVHRIRIAPTLSAPSTLRVEPSAYISREDIDRFVQSTDRFCTALEQADLPHLAGLRDARPRATVQRRSSPRASEAAAVGDAAPEIRRVAFLGHLLTPREVAAWEPQLMELSLTELNTYWSRLSPVIDPWVASRTEIRSGLTGSRVGFSIIGLPFTAREAMESLRRRDTNWGMAKIEAAVDLARQEGSQIVGLGGYVSILSRHASRIRPDGVYLTTGSSLTAGFALQALKRAAVERGVELGRACVGVVGGLGNIASANAVMLAPEVGELVVLVRFPRSPRVATRAAEIRAVAPDVPVRFTADPSELRRCSLILAASNEESPLIRPEHLGPELRAICDIAVPPDVHPDVSEQRPDVLLIKGGLVRLPENRDLEVWGSPLPPGHVYSCMAEALLMGLERVEEHGSVGRIGPERVQWALELAERHGFALGGFVDGAKSPFPWNAS